MLLQSNSRMTAFLAVSFGILLNLPFSATAQMNGAGTSTVPQAATTVTIEATGDRVMLYCGNDGRCDEGLTVLSDYYAGEGIGVDQLTSLPTDLSSYRLIYIILPRAAFSTAQKDQLAAFVAAGGRIVGLSDFNSFYSGQAHLNNLMDGLGVSMTADGSGPLDSGCNNFSTDITADQITNGIASYQYGASDTVTGGTTLIRSVTNSLPIVAVDQAPGMPPRPGYDVVLAGDSNAFTDLCSPNNQTLWHNLYAYSGHACDLDQSGGYDRDDVRLYYNACLNRFDAPLLCFYGTVIWAVRDCGGIPPQAIEAISH